MGTVAKSAGTLEALNYVVMLQRVLRGPQIWSVLLSSFPYELLSAHVLSIPLEIGGISMVPIQNENVLVLCQVNAKNRVVVE